MPSFVTRNRIYRASCNGVEIRIVQTPELAYLSIRGRGHDQYVELAEQDVAALVGKLEAINGDPEKFQEFVAAAAAERQNRARAPLTTPALR
jgi:hypothetical protein